MSMGSAPGATLDVFFATFDHMLRCATSVQMRVLCSGNELLWERAQADLGPEVGLLASCAPVSKEEEISVFQLWIGTRTIGSVPVLRGFVVGCRAEVVHSDFACLWTSWRRVDEDEKGSAASTCPSTVETVAEDAASNSEPSLDDAPLLAAGENPLLGAVTLFANIYGDHVDCPVAMLDLCALERRVRLWRDSLPRVQPFYAVKCNPTRQLVAHLWRLFEEFGGGFDCATPAEIALVKDLGAPTDRIIYAHPCKQLSAVSFAQTTGVAWLTFDNEMELDKVQQLYPSARLILRLQTDDKAAKSQLSNKFGAAPHACRELLLKAALLGLAVDGVSFHVGSNCSQRGGYRSALEAARRVFDEAGQLGFAFTVLDIGGGFPGSDVAGEACFADHACDISAALDELFPCPNIRVIAEPGRFFATQSQALMTTVTGLAEASSTSGPGFRYFLNDGLYGTFNCLVFDHFVVPRPLIIRGKVVVDSVEEFPCTLFGPTCDGLDMISDRLTLPRLRIGDRLVFADMGAYTASGCTTFNGFPLPRTFVYRSSS